MRRSAPAALERLKFPIQWLIVYLAEPSTPDHDAMVLLDGTDLTGTGVTGTAVTGRG